MDISFVHVGLAAGAALAAVPVILHLFMKQTPKHVIFPALQLIRERHKRSRKKLRIKNWLLLLARMAMLALMALALARPALNSQANLGDREVPTALGLVFDTSLSMGYTERNATRLAEAKQRAAEVLNKTPETSQVFVVDSADPGPPAPLSPSAAKKRIDALTIRPANRPLNGALGLAYRAVADSDRPRREVYVLTDLARSSWDLARPADGLDLARNPKLGIATYVLRLTPKEVRDAGVVDARPASGVATQGEPVEVKATVRCTGPARSQLVEFFVDQDERGRPIKREQKTVEIPANGEAEVSFRTPGLGVGLHQGEVRLGGTDGLEFDDHRYFTLQVEPAMRVLVVSDARLDAEFVGEALDPAKLRSAGVRPFRVDRIAPAQLGPKLRESARDYACIFLLNVPQPGEAEWSRLNGYVHDGGGLVIAAGDRVDRESYNNLIAAQVVPATLDATKTLKDPTSFGKADFSHPLFGRYPRELDADLSGVPVYRYWSSTPARDGRVVLAYQDGAPALVERTIRGPKPGHVLLWTTPLARVPEQDRRASWNDFPLFWSFFYLMNESVPYLSGVAGEKLNYEAGDDAVLPLGPPLRNAKFLVRDPQKKTPDPYTPLASNPVLMIPGVQSLGQWTVAPSAPGGKALPALGFSVNPPASEAQVAPLEPRELDSLFGKDRYALADDTESLKHAVAQGRVGRELFPWLMALILAVVTAENFLANTFYRDRK